ncbi:MAG: transporter substrate-binding domain-containing protein [Kangiellaceae bacterium]|nr:transporter substrate-binding domain-containing protein [Kangiellaceae bacterium]
MGRKLIILRKIAIKTLSIFFSLGVYFSYIEHIYGNEAPEQTDDHCELNFAFGIWEPFQYFDENNKLVGTHIEFVREIGKRSNCVIHFHQMQFSQVLEAIRKGTIDFTANVTPTPPRKNYGQFSSHYAIDYFALYLHYNSSHQYKQRPLRELLKSGFRLGITKAHYYGEEFEKIREDPQLMQYVVQAADSYDNYQMLLDGEVDGFLDNPLVAAFTIRDRSLEAVIDRHLTVFFVNPVSFMFSRKVSPETVEKIDQVVKQLKQAPDYTEKWNLNQ